VHPRPAGGVGPVDNDRSQDLGAGRSGDAPTEGGGGVEGRRRGRVPERGRLGVGRLRFLLRARLQSPGGGLLPRLVILLQAGAGTPCSQLHHCSFDLHPFL
jgi:hypothetical protein